MKQYVIPHTDLKVSRLAYGTWHLGGTWDKTPPTDEIRTRANDLIVKAYELGINHVDLADIYTLGKSDEVVGYALKQNPDLRDKLVLQAKAGIVIGDDPDFGQPSRYDFSSDHLVQAVETSLQRLGTDYVDLLAFHRPDPLVDLEEVARAAEHLHKEGMVRYFGVSNHSAAQLELLQNHIDYPLVVNQLELSLLHPYLISNGILVNRTDAPFAHTDGTLEYCRLKGVMIQAWSPVAGGRLFKPSDDAPQNERDTADLIAKLAGEKETSKEAIALSWLLRHPMGIQPILGTEKTSRLESCAQADEVELTRREWYRLLEAARGESVP